MMVAIIFVLIVAGVAWKVTRSTGPSIQVHGPLKGIGQSTPVNFTVMDTRYRIKRVRAELRQGDRIFPMVDLTLPRTSWWRFWSRAGKHQAEVQTRAGRQAFPDLQEGRATLHLTATNDSWGRFFRGGQADISLDLPVRFAPPQVQVVTTQHYVHQGGCDMVVFTVSPGTIESGVKVGDYFFPSFPVKGSMPETRLCVFAYPYDVDPKTPARIVARDDAGNETVTGFTYEVFPRKFKSDTLTITDDFMSRVVPPIMSQTPAFDDQGSLLKNFLWANSKLRQLDAEQFVALSHKTAPQFLWTKPFVQLENSKVEASFADYRTYRYNGQEVDHETHLGFDLAVVQHTPVAAANDGVVVFAGFLGIYGNAIVLDHGCGLQSLYAHLSSIDVKVGDAVKRAMVIGRSGQTGLAGGDHLHFCMLLDGIPVNPVEWWDAHWIHDRIEVKLQAYP